MLRIAAVLFMIFASLPMNGSGANAEGGPEVSLSLNPGPESAEIKVGLINSSDQAQVFEFPTSQRYDLIIRDKSGEIVYDASAGKSFLQAIQYLKLNPGEFVSWTESWDYETASGRVGEGSYSAELSIPLKRKGENHASVVLRDKAQLDVPEENPAFRKVEVSGENGVYEVRGEARAETGRFYYTAEDGHQVLAGEAAGPSDSKFPDWSPFHFKINIPEKSLPENGTVILSLYEKDKEGRVIHTYAAVLENFR
ncbi:hypothetical protein FZD47_13860 [Bacillus infantis]|uniref:Intracellular proteinase inhibitor BsuPI domain-containing protein n=1 Tax=Bacillus infantis TaxID=324767 RepID=A0A5D4SHM9_9BACI|nr:BsuPI-related putative proteinase inhibitor [Bacillus infantis]TYS62759.1 hypothetical protein FZD47_13860 [Bacillus infantis]